MKKKRFSIFRRISILVFVLITGLCILFISITYLSTTNFHLASTQLLNKDVAGHIAQFTSPFGQDSINTKKADSVFYNAMVLSPSAEVYFLDTSGKVIAYHAPKSALKRWTLPLANIKKLIASKGQEFIKGPDPKDPLEDKIFSAVEVKGKKRNLGYIYVILGSNKNVTNLLFSSYVSNFLVKVLCLIIVSSIVAAFIYLKRIERSFNDMMLVLNRFQNGDLQARFKIKEKNELSDITQVFNNLADLLVFNIDRLKKSEKERKDFIANISHDLRTPLAIARGYIETLVIKKDTEELSLSEHENYVQIALNKIKQVDEMVSQLFELSRIESVEFKAAKEPFVLSEIVQETVKTFQLAAAQKSIDLKCTRCQYHVWINADVSMMERVVQNLIDNAVNNTPENGIIQISVIVENNQLVLKIQNTGDPLPDNLLEWINNSKDESTLSAKWSSRSGVGLLIVKKILQLHESSLKAYTDNTDGNTFTFGMPVYNQ
jgi:signal transduction histidine kinase